MIQLNFFILVKTAVNASQDTTMILIIERNNRNVNLVLALA